MTHTADMEASVESAILNLIHNATNEGQDKGFREIKSLFKDPSANESLCKCIVQSQDPQVRRYAALLLRRRLLKSKHWRRISSDKQEELKEAIFQAYLRDTEKIVRSAIAELIATIAKHDLQKGRWPKLMELINQSIRSNNGNDREIGMYTISIMTKVLGNKFKSYFKGLLILFQTSLADRTNISIPYYTLKALTHMVCHIGTEELNLFQALLPSVFLTIRELANTDQERASECLEIFDELVESEVAIIVPHLKTLIELCLELAATEKYDEELRIKAVNIIAYLIRLKKKAVMKQRLVQPILEVLFPLMCRPCPGDKDEDDDEEIEQSLPSAAGQAIDVMALNLPPSKFIPLLMHHLEPAVESQNVHHRKAAFLAISVIAEGCSEYIRHKHLQGFVQVICRGIKDQDSIVRNAALYAVGQFAEYMQPDISKYASELLPVLFEYLQKTCILLQSGKKKPPSLMRTFYALERFCETMENIEPYLPTLMSCLITFLTIETEDSLTVKELAIEAIGSVATSAKELFVPYFHQVVGHLKQFISVKETEATRSLQTQSIDTLSLIARSVGAEVFRPIAHECIDYAMHLLQETEDPDVRRACYCLISSVSTVLKTEMAPYLSAVVERILVTLKSNEGIGVNTIYADNPTPFTLLEEEDDEDEEIENGDMCDENLQSQDEEEEDYDDVTGFSVENAYMHEKEGALTALKEISEEVGTQFVPYIETCFNEIRRLTETPSDEVRRSAITAMGQFCFTLNQAHLETGNLECRAALENDLNVLMPKIFSLAREDTEHSVVIACMETLQDLVDKLKLSAIYGGNLESICDLIKDAFTNKLACQDEDVGGDEEDAQEAEYDSMVMEYAGELIASLIKVVPWQQFGPYLAGLMPQLFARTKKACTVSEKSFAIGTLADITSHMHPGTIRAFITHLQPVFLAGMKDENEEVRSNAVYGLGVLVQNANELLYEQYPTYLQALSNMIAVEEDPRAKDNIAGAVARLIKTNINLVPMKEVFPVFLKKLPLQEDMEENNTIFDVFLYLYSIRYEMFFQSLPEILKIVSDMVAKQSLNDQNKVLVVNFIKSVSNEFPADFENIVKSLPQEQGEVLLKARSV